MLLIPHQLKTYSQVLSIARDMVQRLEKKRRVKLQHKPMKCQFQQVHRGNPVRSFGAPLAKRPFQPPSQSLVWILSEAWTQSAELPYGQWIVFGMWIRQPLSGRVSIKEDLECSSSTTSTSSSSGPPALPARAAPQHFQHHR